MADIFISHSKPDRFEVEKLAAMLEAEGWSVWWDKSLTAGDAYRDEIMKQLANARAVIAVWTPVSIKSDWVRAEAGRAKADGKLIPVKSDNVTYGDLPMPFGEMHTLPLTNSELIRAAVVAQLTKAEMVPSTARIAAAEFRYALLSWMGMFGAAVTLFSNFGAVINMADWARTLVDNWTYYSFTMWCWMFSWLQIQIQSEWSHVLNFAGFATIVTLGQRQNMTSVRSQAFSISKVLATSLLGLLLFFLVFIILSGFWNSESEIGKPGILWVYGATVGISFFAGLYPAIRANGDNAESYLFAVIWIYVFGILAVVPILFLNFGPQARPSQALVWAAIAAASTMIVLGNLALGSVPTRLLNRRLIQTLAGVMTLLFLNEISKLELKRLSTSAVERSAAGMIFVSPPAPSSRR